ncbi:glycosyltransferase family 25 protein [Rhizobium sp. 2MFCol3.1]|uniref:glycosyltransferase family 25 protein n=1 Tax=Rhizobium sp. 2MFCol3.1 TaxID=1246459 RepID=UPI0003608F30|nr:glycosyltransferase family 25 protein [Rhizobium sp. 2MFCol3.1]
MGRVLDGTNAFVRADFKQERSFLTLLINLDRAEARLQSMVEQMNTLGLPFERIAAVDGRALDFPIADYDEAGFRRRHGRMTNPGEVGCYLSHVACARRLLETTHDYALILEDDLVLPDNLAVVIGEALAEHRHWDVLRLSSVNDGRKFPVVPLSQTRSLAIALTREKGSGAYLINRKAAEWICNDLVPMKLPYDIAFDLEFFDGLRGMFVSPVPISQEAGFPSDIQQGRRFRLPLGQRYPVYVYRAGLEIARVAHRASRLAAYRLASLVGRRKSCAPLSTQDNRPVDDDLAA